MSRTTRCLFALGLSVSLAAACGDDDAIIAAGGTGGTAGSGGSSGSAGSAGDAGSGGDGGSSAGTGGSSAGTGGSSAGTGGSTAGTGGSGDDLPDAGADAASDAGSDPLPDGGDEPPPPPVDAGPDPIECPADLEAATAGATSSEATQQVIITRLAFVGDDIQVTFRALVDFEFGSPLQLCTGSDSSTDCDENFYDVGVGDGGTQLSEGDEVTFTTPIGDIIDAASGEIALINGVPDVDVDPIIRAYVNWGGYVSLDAPDGPNAQSLEEAAVEEGTGGVWTAGDSVAVNGQTTIYATGDVTGAAGFEVCTQAP